MQGIRIPQDINEIHPIVLQLFKEEIDFKIYASISINDTSYKGHFTEQPKMNE